jgi:hypothetical protein
MTRGQYFLQPSGNEWWLWLSKTDARLQLSPTTRQLWHILSQPELIYSTVIHAAVSTQVLRQFCSSGCSLTTPFNSSTYFQCKGLNLATRQTRWFSELYYVPCPCIQEYLHYVINQQRHINKIYFVLSYITIYQHVLVTSVTINRVSYKNINNVKITDKMYNN